MEYLYSSFKTSDMFKIKPSFLKDVPDLIRNSPKLIDIEKLVINYYNHQLKKANTRNGKTRCNTRCNTYYTTSKFDKFFGFCGGNRFGHKKIPLFNRTFYSLLNFKALQNTNYRKYTFFIEHKYNRF